MQTTSYISAINYAVSISPEVYNATKFLNWADNISELIAFIYSKDVDTVLEYLVDECKEAQNYED